MAEYIQRETLLERAEYDNNYRLIIPSEAIKAAPAADVAPVVRCKGCKHRVYKYINEEIGEIGGCELFNRAMSNDDFCSYGEYQTNGGADHENQRN